MYENLDKHGEIIQNFIKKDNFCLYTFNYNVITNMIRYARGLKLFRLLHEIYFLIKTFIETSD